MENQTQIIEENSTSFDNKTKSCLKNNRAYAHWVFGGLAVLFIVLTIFFTSQAFIVGAKAAGEAYTISKEVYDIFFHKAKEAHSVSNDVSIIVDSLHEENELEVLHVQDVAYEISDEDEDVVSWLEIPGEGVYTIDLKSSEFILDNEHKHILIRVPPPELSQFKILYEDVLTLYFEDEWFKESQEVGVNIARENLSNAEGTMIRNIMNNQRFEQAARESAVQIINGLVKDINPELPELTVEVEFLG